MGRLIFYIVATSYLRRGRRDVKLRDQDVLRKLFAEWVGPGHIGSFLVFMYLLWETENSELLGSFYPLVLVFHK